MTKIDLSAQDYAEWTAHFRCGGKAVIAKHSFEGRSAHRLEFSNTRDCFLFERNGQQLNKFALLDIIDITPPDFDWSEAELGMAFSTENGAGVYYVCDGDNKDGTVLVTKDMLWLHKDALTRCPERDLPTGWNDE